MVQSAVVDESELVQNKVPPPLHQGKCFVCYRDVNKAIEKHKEMFGLKLALKRAVKLENYCLTVEQMKDLNLKLKYGELDYHCFVATGRPGRPGNDERCPQLVRLKLNADAQSLVVYEYHNHILPTAEGTMAHPALKHNMDLIALTNNKPICLKGEITVTPIGPVHKNPVLILPKPIQDTNAESPGQSNKYLINSNNSFTSLIPISSPISNSFTLPTDSEHNSVTIIPAPTSPICLASPEAANVQDGHEKITVKIKKSECVPNEMVVVGSLRHAQEQQKAKGTDETMEQKCIENKLQSPNTTTTMFLPKSSPQISKEIPVSRNSPTTLTSVKISPSPSLVGFSKLFSNQNVNVKPPGTSAQSIPTTIKSPNVIKTNNAETKIGSPKTGNVPTPRIGNVPTPKTSNVPTPVRISSPQLAPNKVVKRIISPKIIANSKPTVLKQSPNMKQIIVDKPSHKYVGLTKPSTKLVSAGKQISNVCYQPSTVKQGQPKAPGNLKFATSAKTGATTPGSCGKISSTVNSIGASKSSDKLVVKQNDRQGSTTNEKTVKAAHSKQTSSVVSNGAANHSSGSKLMSIPKKLRKKPGRPPDSSNTASISTSGTLDTELGYGEKQQLAHGVLLQLLKVTSQLPMVEFSHALDTLEVLTDAFRLSQRVSLSIRHDQDELSHNSFDDYFDPPYTSDDHDFKVSSTTDDNRLADAQLDGQLDANELLKSLACLDSVVPNMNEDLEELMDIEPPKVPIVMHANDSHMADEGAQQSDYSHSCVVLKTSTENKDLSHLTLPVAAKRDPFSLLNSSKYLKYPERMRAHKRSLSFSSIPDAKRYKQQTFKYQ